MFSAADLIIRVIVPMKCSVPSGSRRPRSVVCHQPSRSRAALISGRFQYPACTVSPAMHDLAGLTDRHLGAVGVDDADAGERAGTPGVADPAATVGVEGGQPADLGLAEPAGRRRPTGSRRGR